LEHHSANQFLKAATNLNFVQRNCFKLLVKMISASPIEGVRHSNFDKQMQASASVPYVDRSIATIMFADKPHASTNELVRSIFCVLTILPPVPHSRWATRAAGYRAAISCIGTLRHADFALSDVRF